MELLQVTTKNNYRRGTRSFCSRTEHRLLKARTAPASLCAALRHLRHAENTAVSPVSSTSHVPLTAVWKSLYLPTTAKAQVLAAPHTWLFLPLHQEHQDTHLKKNHELPYMFSRKPKTRDLNNFIQFALITDQSFNLPWFHLQWHYSDYALITFGDYIFPCTLYFFQHCACQLE